jgi:hypothetical protein
LHFPWVSVSCGSGFCGNSGPRQPAPKASSTVMETYSKAMDDVAGLDIAATTAPDSTDTLILTAAVGMHVHSQLLLKLLALAQASHAIRRYEHGA